MWTTKTVVRWHKGHYRTMEQAICSDCGASGGIAGWINAPALPNHNCMESE
jgi:hypothetical protein